MAALQHVGAACVNVTGATQKTYLLTTADAGRTMRVRVTGINAEGAANARSAPTEVVARARPRETRCDRRSRARGRPGVGGGGRSWTNSPTAYAYQWQRCDVDAISCVVVAGATGKTYGVRAADRLPAARRGDRPQRQRRLVGVDPVRDRRAVRPGDERAAGGPVDLVRFSVPAYARFRICDDSPRNPTILDGLAAGQGLPDRRFTTRIAPNPCGVYTRSWVPAARFRGKGRYTVTIAVRDTSARTSAPARKTFSLR